MKCPQKFSGDGLFLKSKFFYGKKLTCKRAIICTLKNAVAKNFAGNN
jgi:hypothetical protein